MRQDIIDAFWNVYEQEAFNRLNELIRNYDLSVTNEQIDRYVFEAILSVDKNEIIKLWREKCMFLLPQVEQHQMVPFHDRWIQSQFKEENNIAKMQERLCIRAKASTHWLTELVDDLTVSPEAHPSQECSFEQEPEALYEGRLQNLDRIGSDRIDKTRTGSDRINKTRIGLRPIDKTRTGSEKEIGSP